MNGSRSHAEVARVRNRFTVPLGGSGGARLSSAPGAGPGIRLPLSAAVVRVVESAPRGRFSPWCSPWWPANQLRCSAWQAAALPGCPPEEQSDDATG
jgi:hypothetical protein